MVWNTKGSNKFESLKIYFFGKKMIFKKEIENFENFWILKKKIKWHCPLHYRKSSWVVDLLLEHEQHFETKLMRINYYHSEDCSQLERLKSAFEQDSSIDLRISKRLPSDFSKTIVKRETAIFLDDKELDFSDKSAAEALYNLASVLTSHLQCYTHVNN